MRISVILPTYKPQDYLADCLESLSKQTLAHDAFEIIIVLNGCDEPWHSQVDELISRFLNGFNVRLIHTAQSGVSNARNIGIETARGEFITFIDDDDYISPAYLEELLKESSRDCVALSDSVYFDDMNHVLNWDNPHHRNFTKNQGKNHLTLFGTRVFFNGPVMKLIHRDIIGERRFDPHFANGEDNLMMLNISDRIQHVRLTSPEAIYYRRIRPNSATTRKTGKWYVVTVSWRLMGQYIAYYVRNPFGYNLPFVLSRFAAEIKSMILN